MAQKQTKELEIVVTGLGMVTPVGHNSKQTCASIRAGIARLTESEEFLIPNEKGHLAPVLCGAVSGITDGHRRFLRILRMAVPACCEAIMESRITKENIKHCGLYIGLPEQDRPGMDTRAEKSLANRIGRALEAEDVATRTQVFTAGHSAVYYALQEALKDLMDGKYRYGIIGAVDTYLDEMTLKFLQDFDRLRTKENSKGFIPSEGAAFFVLETHYSAVNRKVLALAKMQGAATALEKNTIYEDAPCKGEGLSESIQKTLLFLDDRGTQTGLVICDLNGERYRSLEWGLAVSRALRSNRIPLTTWHPSDCIGDTGAASGAINICLGVTALVRGYANSTNIMLWGSSDYGDRGSAYLRAL